MQPNEPEEQRIQLLLNLIKPSLRKALRPMVINDFASLLTKALQAEKDDNDEAQTRVSKPAPSKEEKQSGKPKSSDPKNYLPKCWHCPGRHYNRDCEVYKAQKRDNPENWRQAPATATPGANKSDKGQTSVIPTVPRPDSHK